MCTFLLTNIEFSNNIFILQKLRQKFELLVYLLIDRRANPATGCYSVVPVPIDLPVLGLDKEIEIHNGTKDSLPF